MSHKYVLLKEVCGKASSNIAQKDLAECDGIYPIYGASGYIKSVDFFQQAKDYIAIVKDGAGIGRAMKLPAKSSVIGTMQYILPNDNINISYLYYAICSMHLEKYFSGATIPHIYFRDYQNEQLPLPTLEEQVKIANVFGRIDYFIKKEKEQLINLDKLVKSRFIEMFGDPVTNEKGWVKVRLADKCCIITGNTPPRANEKYYGSYIEWIKSDNITSSMYLTKAAEYLSEEGLAVGKKVESGSVLMTCIAGSLKSIGNVAIADRPVTFNQQINAVVTNEQNTLFMYEQFKLTKEYITCDVNMALKGILSKGQLSEKQFIFPPIELQNQFADFVAQVDKSKLAIQQSLDELETLKKSLMQQYFG